MRIETSEVLAGAYKGGRASLKAMLTHSVDMDVKGDAREIALCGQKNLAMYSSSGEDVAPTCTRCLRKDPRFKKEN